MVAMGEEWGLAAAYSEMPSSESEISDSASESKSSRGAGVSAESEKSLEEIEGFAHWACLSQLVHGRWACAVRHGLQVSQSAVPFAQPALGREDTMHLQLEA
jgi:hypothetical protein